MVDKRLEFTPEELAEAEEQLDAMEARRKKARERYNDKRRAQRAAERGPKPPKREGPPPSVVRRMEERDRKRHKITRQITDARLHGTEKTKVEKAVTEGTRIPKGIYGDHDVNMAEEDPMTKPDHQQFYNVDTPDKEDFELQQEQTKGEVAKKERRETPGNPNWYKGMGKAPGAGRKKGVPNKLKPETAAHTMLRVSKRFPYNPIEFLVRVYHNDPVLLQQLPENQEVIPIETRVTAAKTVAQYLYPAVKAADAGDGQSKDAVVFNVNVTTASGDKDTVKISAQKGDQTIDVNPETGEQE